MPQPYKVFHGGLMRCCLATLNEAMHEAVDAPQEGEVLPCKYHPEDNSMIFRDGAWRWNRPAELDTRDMGTRMMGCGDGD